MIDVVILTYNQERWIDQAINSVLNQRTTAINRIIVADDASKDRTADIVQNIADQHHGKIHLLAQKTNLGINRNYFTAIQHCQSPWVAFLEGDDYWSDADKIALQLQSLSENPTQIASVHPVQVVDELNQNLNEALPPCRFGGQKILDPYPILSIYPPVFHTGSLVVKTEVIRQCDRTEFDFSPAKDMAIHYLLLQMGEIGVIPSSLGVYRLLQNSAFNSISLLKKTAIEILTHLRLHPLLHGELKAFHKQRIALYFKYWAHISAEPSLTHQLPAAMEWIIQTNDEEFIQSMIEPEYCN
ncbi:MAG: glycosyltransferase [Candidatus Pacebacteria bacterium]|nr:glycosyltransferase [Candidatus Paceibacterota bacterium]